MGRLFNNNTRIIQDTSWTQNFSRNTYIELIAKLQELVIEYIKIKTTLNNIEFIPEIHWLDPVWRVTKIGSAYYRLGIYLETSKAILKVCLEDFIDEKSKCKLKNYELKAYSPVRALKVNLDHKLMFDLEELGYVLFKCVDDHYRGAAVDYRAALKNFTVASGADDFYDILRKSSISQLLLKDISLYCVYKGDGRHIPSLERLGDIIPRINKSIHRRNACSLRLASDFFLAPLDGSHTDLYTQKAFREGKALLAPGDKYSGGSNDFSVKMATEAFFHRQDVTVYPVVASGDEQWLCSAIFPATIEIFVKPELDRLKPEFTRLMEQSQDKSRESLNKIKMLYVPNSDSSSGVFSGVGEILGGIIKAFMPS